MLGNIKKNVLASKAVRYEAKYKSLYSKASEVKDTSKRAGILKKAEIYFDKYITCYYRALGYVKDASRRYEAYRALENIKKLHNIEKILNS